jgi:photosystem II stability/assembly factor-like uncharacterized protein
MNHIRINYTLGFLTSAVILTIIGLFLTEFFNSEKVLNSKLDKKHAPWDDFMFQRSYPDKEFSYRSYMSGLEYVNKQSRLKSTTFAGNINWRFEGPTNIGGRINKVTVNPLNPAVLYVGNASGGVFKSTDTGNTWLSVFENFPYLAVGEITIDPQDTNRIYVGTGDPNISGYPFMGDGVYKSNDGGNNWSYLGLSEASIVSKIIVHPTDSLTIFAATMGLPFVRNIHRGLYKSTDGGQTWVKVLYINNESGIADLVMDPSNPNTLYAAGWTRIRNNTESLGYGMGAKIFKSIDCGETWSQLGGGLPTTSQSRIGLAISASNPSVLYASYVGTNYDMQNIYKTTNGGITWNALGLTTDIQYNTGGFGWYFGQIRVSPVNPNEVYLLGVDLYKSIDGGISWVLSGDSWWDYTFHADKHDLVYAPGNVLYCATDGGMYRSTDFGVSWTDCEDIPNTQFYRVACDMHNPGFYAGGTQDNGTIYGINDSVNSWQRLYGGDGFQVLFDPANQNLMYAETQNGGLVYRQNNLWNYFGNGIPSADRRSWDMPLVMSQSNTTRMYTGTFRVLRNNAAPLANWSIISPDLTNGVATSFHVITSVAESSLDSSVLYAGTSDAFVWRSLNAGSSWQNVTTGLPGRYITDIKASPSLINTVYVSNSGYKDNEFLPHIHRSDNNGGTWSDISGDLPQIAVNHILVLPGFADQVIFLATDGGVYITQNAGTNWERIGWNMPVLPVYDIDRDIIHNRLVAGTFGRSMYSVSIDSLLLITGISKPSGSECFKIYPTVASDFIQFESSCNLSRIELFNSSGILIKTISAQNSNIINVSGLKSGIYFLRTFSGGKTFSQKFVKR